MGNTFRIGSTFVLSFGETFGGLTSVGSYISIDKQGVALGFVDTADLEGRITNDGALPGDRSREPTG